MKKALWRSLKKEKGNVADIMTMGLLVISMAVVMISFMNCTKLIRIREDVSQISRKYLLMAETEGYLTNANRQEMEAELTSLGITNLDLTGTTLSEVGYGSIVEIQIRGKVEGKYEISQRNASTAKY